jgi:hypothetical protein
MINIKIIEQENKALFENNLLSILKRSKEFESKRIARSPRAVGDIVQDIVSEEAVKCFPTGLVAKFNGKFARRAMADIAFDDIDGNYFIIDIKTHNKNTDFNMPNLTSVERLARFYEDDTNFFIILLIEYEFINEELNFVKVSFNPIEHFKWDCLTIGALGWGQIQIANANYINIEQVTRKSWMLDLCDVLDIFYPREIEKIDKRIDRFRKVREYWESKS